MTTPFPRGRWLLAAGLFAIATWISVQYFTRRSIDRSFLSAKQAMAAGRPEDAEPDIARCLRSRGSDPEVLFWSARFARLRGEFALAAERFQRAVDLGWPREPVALELALIRAQRGERESAGFLADCVGRDHPDSVFILEILVPQLFADYQIEAAAELAEKWTDLQPDRAAAWLTRAGIANRLRLRDDEQAALRRVLEIDPANAKARASLASSYLERRRATDALPLVESPGDDRQLSLLLAKCRRFFGEFDAARVILDRLAVANPNDPAVLMERGLVELEASEPIEAEKWFSAAVAHPPFDSEALLHLAVSQERNGKSADAAASRERFRRSEADLLRLQEVTRQVSRTPADPAPRREAGEILLRNGNEAEGLRWLRSALEVSPTDPETRRILEASTRPK